MSRKLVAELLQRLVSPERELQAKDPSLTAAISRRRFLEAAAALAAVPLPARAVGGGFGPLRPDPARILDLPEGFDYSIVSRSGDEMDDGLLVPARPDGMAAFPGSGNSITLVCNHENHPRDGGPFGDDNERLNKIDPRHLYDRGSGETPGTGGTTTLVYDPTARQTLRRHLSLAGTEVNCAGGPTPWGSWLSCEECFEQPGRVEERSGFITRERRHGYVFEVPASSTSLADPIPLKDMGRFEHEAAAIDAETGAIYLTEDRHSSLLYRFLPRRPGDLSHGGQLQALEVDGAPGFDTRNWDRPEMPLREWLSARWIDLEDVDTDENDLRIRGRAEGAAVFARGEGLCIAGRSAFFTATIGGPARLGQLFEYRSDNGGELRLFAESTADDLLHNADNLTMSGWGDLIVCEDTAANCGLVGVTPSGTQYPLANHPYSLSELAGVCFAPDGKTLFVNVQHRGLTLAIHGPWPGAA